MIWYAGGVFHAPVQVALDAFVGSFLILFGSLGNQFGVFFGSRGLPWGPLGIILGVFLGSKGVLGGPF